MKLSLIAVLVAGALIAPHHITHAAEHVAENRLMLGVDDCVRIALKSAPELGEARAGQGDLRGTPGLCTYAGSLFPVPVQLPHGMGQS